MLCDFVEDDTVFFFHIQIQHICQMPGNRLSLTVGVTCQIYMIAFFREVLQLLNDCAFVTADLVGRLEIILNIDSQTTLAACRKITYMSFG